MKQFFKSYYLIIIVIVGALLQFIGRTYSNLSSKEKDRIVQNEENYVFKDIDHLKTDKEAMIEWNLFRKNEKKYKGKLTKWKLKANFVSNNGDITSYIKKPYGDNKVVINIHSYFQPRVKKDDTFIITGEFMRIRKDGSVELHPTKIINLGYQ